MGNECSICNHDLRSEPYPLINISSSSDSEESSSSSSSDSEPETPLDADDAQVLRSHSWSAQIKHAKKQLKLKSNQTVPTTTTTTTQGHNNIVHVVTTPCGHIYHQICITGWLTRAHHNQSICPECHTNISNPELVQIPPTLVTRAIQMQGASFLSVLNENKAKERATKLLIASLRDRLQNAIYKKSCHASSSSHFRKELKNVQGALGVKEHENKELSTQVQGLKETCTKKDEELKGAWSQVKKLKDEVAQLQKKCKNDKRADDEVFNLVQTEYSEVIDFILEKKARLSLLKNKSTSPSPGPTTSGVGQNVTTSGTNASTAALTSNQKVKSSVNTELVFGAGKKRAVEYDDWDLGDSAGLTSSSSKRVNKTTHHQEIVVPVVVEKPKRGRGRPRKVINYALP